MNQQKLTVRVNHFIISNFVVMLLCASAHGQIITPSTCISMNVTVGEQSLANNLVIDEGDDYATAVLQRPWDFNTPGVRYIGYEESYNPPRITTGGSWVATGDGGSKAGALYPLFAGFPDANNENPLPTKTAPPKFGSNWVNQVNAGQYNYLSFRFRHNSRSNFVVQWKYQESLTDEVLNDSVTIPDRFPESGLDFIANNWNIYGVDLVEDFIGTISELKFIPSNLATNSTSRAEFDWIRLVDPESGPEIEFEVILEPGFTNCGILFSASKIVTIYLDANGIQRDGEDTPLLRGTLESIAGSHTLYFTFPSAALPPGNYRFYTEVRDRLTGEVLKDNFNPSKSIVSPQTAQLGISPRPLVRVTAPAPNSASSYDSDVLGNLWDMDNPEDIPNFAHPLNVDVNTGFDPYSFLDRNFIDPEIAGTGAVGDPRIFRAKTANDNSLQDPALHAQVHLSVDSLKPIDPENYRYLVYRIRAREDSNSAKYLKIQTRAQTNWFSQAVYWNTAAESNYGWSKEQFVYEGANTYVLDLWEDGVDSNKSWLSHNRISNLRIHPLNTTDAGVFFEVDDVKLYQENVAETESQYEIRYQIENAAAGNVRACFYYDTVNALFSTDEAFFIGCDSQLKGNGDHSYLWNIPADIECNECYVYVELQNSTSGADLSGSYSTVPVIISKDDPIYDDAELDYDGDGKSDHVVYRPATGQIFQRRSGSESVFIPWVAGQQFVPVAGDFDGDGITDLALAFNFFSYIGWYIYKSDVTLPPEERLYIRVWGRVGDSIAVGDYLGRGKDQIAVFRNGEWYIIDEEKDENGNDIVDVRYWGQAGDVPVNADYDGDGIEDIAVWRPATGEWIIINSSIYSAQNLAPWLTVQQWGLPGDIPLPGDWHDEAKASFAVYRPSELNWYIYNPEDPATPEVVSWGIPGDLPVVGDFNGDGYADLTMYRSSGGMWYHNFRNKRTAAVQYGLPGDKVPTTISVITK